jgi:glycosyltransferase involved in cell wall biosynthesis
VTSFSGVIHAFDSLIKAMEQGARGKTYGFCMVNRAGWKSVRARFEHHLPLHVPGSWAFGHLEDHANGIGDFTRKIGKFQMFHDVACGYGAAAKVIREGARKVIFGTYHNCAYLPFRKGVRYYIYGDATMKQLANLGYTGANRDVSRMAKVVYGYGLRRLVKGGHHFLCMSTWFAEGLKREHGAPDSQITIIPPFVDTEYWHPREGERRPGPLRLLFIGADFRRKGGDILEQAFVHPELQEVEWHLVTKSPPENLPAHVQVYTGFNSEADGLRNLVRDCDLLVLPTYADSCSLASLEASASGLPSVITGMAGITDLVEHGKTGHLLSNPPTLEELVVVLGDYLKHPELIAEQGLAAREKALREFDSKVVMERIRDLLLI